MSVVVDASVIVAALVDVGPVGEWAEAKLEGVTLAAPHLMPEEVANILRRSALRGDISGDTAALAHGDLLDLSVAYYPYEAVAERAWQLRDSLTLYDASYVALAELLDAPLLTLDHRLLNAHGPRCRFLHPDPA